MVDTLVRLARSLNATLFQLMLAVYARVIGRLVPVRELLKSGYIFVQQDVRGRMMSEGTFADVLLPLVGSNTLEA